MRSSRRWGPLAVVLVVGGGALLLADVTTEPAFVNDLSSSDGTAREATIKQLASEPSRLADMLDVLESDAAPIVKAGLAEAIGRMSLSTNSLSGIVTLASSSDVVTRAAAVRILARHASGARTTLAARAQDGAELASIRVVAVRGLGAAGGTALPDLRQVAGDEKAPRAVRDAAVRALAVVSSDGLLDVYDLARESKASRSERENAIDALGEAQGLQRAHGTGEPHPGLGPEPSADGDGPDRRQDPRLHLRGARSGRRRDGPLDGAPGPGAPRRCGPEPKCGAPAPDDTDPRVQGLAAKITGAISSDISSQVTPASRRSSAPPRSRSVARPRSRSSSSTTSRGFTTMSGRCRHRRTRRSRPRPRRP